MTADDRLFTLALALVDGADVDWTREAGADDHAIANLRVLESIARAASAPEAALPAERSFGPLRLLEKLGEGASGEVFRAWDTRLEREVALKLLREGDGPGSRPYQEARLLARVRHPGIVTVHGVETFEGRTGLWTELVRGRTLADLVREDGAFAAAEAARIGIDVCAALEALHRAGLVHGDVKAGNVIREDGGRLVLLDFGAAREDREVGEAVAGTPLYLAPEVLAGDAPPSVASDVYAVGVLLYFLVTGRHPVHAASLAGLRRAHAGGPGRLRDVRDALPAGLAAVVERAIGPARHRHPSAAALRVALERLGPPGRTRGFIAAAIAVAAAGLAVALATRPAHETTNAGGAPARPHATVVPAHTEPLPAVASPAASAPAPTPPPVESTPEPPAQPVLVTAPVEPPVARSTIDRMRDAGEEAFELDLRGLADRAIDAEAAWQVYRSACVGKSTLVRATEGAWAGKVVRVPMEDTPRCRTRRAGVDQLVDPVRMRLGLAEEAARRAGVLPGRIRDLKARYGVDSAPWN